ncbi:unnamed protein product, partial [Effrenium voratum]
KISRISPAEGLANAAYGGVLRRKRTRWMFQDRYAPDDGIQLVETGHSGQSIKLRSNCFRLYWPKESFGIHHYLYQLSDSTVTPKVERSLLESAWPQLKSYLGPTFCVRAPGHIFTPATGDVKSGGGKVETFRLPLELQLEDGTNLEMKVTWAELIAPDEIHGDMGPASVVMNHIVNQLAASRNVQKVGKRHYDTTLEGAKGHHEVISAFSINMVASCVGPLMQLDVMHRPVGRKTLVDVISANMEGTDILQHQADKEIEKEWLRCCVSATVVTSYNNRPYRIKKVHFDKNPSHVFQMYEREARQFIEMSLEKYVEVHYNRKIHMKRQPLLEAFPEKASETVLLLPELCLPTGVNEEIRRDKNPLGEALKQLKVSPQERFNTIVRHAAALHSDAADLCHSWGCSIQKLPLEVEARQLEPLQVAFHEKHDKKSYSVEDGNFSRWLRNGLLCPVTIDNWLLLYPHADEPVLEIWLRSLKDIAKVAFGMALNEPRRRCVSDQRNELGAVLAEEVTPNTQLLLLLTPNRDGRKVYQLFKEIACCERPCISQVVRSDTIRKRQSIAAILSKVVLQINAKFFGALWHVIPREPEEKAFEEFRSVPFMVLGIDVYCTFDGQRWVGLVATLDRPCSQHFSMAALLDQQDWRGSLSLKLQQLFRDALLCFAQANAKVLPQNFLVYRASTDPK